jgi:hypothetical protein
MARRESCSCEGSHYLSVKAAVGRDGQPYFLIWPQFDCGGAYVCKASDMEAVLGDGVPFGAEFVSFSRLDEMFDAHALLEGGELFAQSVPDEDEQGR